ncbi:MAG TPA: hypothetical protein QGH10_10110 [Armatimonadota bacterium]|nr:hypothetical protein [Armatimonadota bacterium]
MSPAKHRLSDEELDARLNAVEVQAPPGLAGRLLSSIPLPATPASPRRFLLGSTTLVAWVAAAVLLISSTPIRPVFAEVVFAQMAEALDGKCILYETISGDPSGGKKTWFQWHADDDSWSVRTEEKWFDYTSVRAWTADTYREHASPERNRVISHINPDSWEHESEIRNIQATLRGVEHQQEVHPFLLELDAYQGRECIVVVWPERAGALGDDGEPATRLRAWWIDANTSLPFLECQFLARSNHPYNDRPTLDEVRAGLSHRRSILARFSVVESPPAGLFELSDLNARQTLDLRPQQDRLLEGEISSVEGNTSRVAAHAAAASDAGVVYIAVSCRSNPPEITPYRHLQASNHQTIGAERYQAQWDHRDDDPGGRIETAPITSENGAVYCVWWGRLFEKIPDSTSILRLVPLSPAEGLVGEDRITIPLRVDGERQTIELNVWIPEPSLATYELPWWTSTCPGWAVSSRGFPHRFLASEIYRHAQQLRRFARQDDALRIADLADEWYAVAHRIDGGEDYQMSADMTRLYMDLYADLGNISEARRHAEACRVFLRNLDAPTAESRLATDRRLAEIHACLKYLDTLE